MNERTSENISRTSHDEVRFRVMRLIQENPQITQRDLSHQLGISLGKTNYCLKALIDKGFVKAKNFRRSDNKLAYAYLLTPAGIEEKARITMVFLRRKMREFEDLKMEIARLQALAEEEYSSVAVSGQKTLSSDRGVLR
jgi:EPS-associated MarR family transcriptional regulator